MLYQNDSAVNEEEKEEEEEEEEEEEVRPACCLGFAFAGLEAGDAEYDECLCNNKTCLREMKCSGKFCI